MASSIPSNVCLEVCIASLDDAFFAIHGGAHRLELNVALELGGLTPSHALFLAVRQAVQVPIIAMVRPRPDGFCYSENDLKVMLSDARFFREAGADGIAFGFLNEDGSINVARCRSMVQAIGSGEAVFHRAFDVTPDPHQALEQLIDLGITRVMTSGQQGKAVDGLPLIAKLVEQAAGRIQVLPASGIRPHNVKQIIRQTGCNQVHASLRGAKTDASLRGRPAVRFSAIAGDQCMIDATDPAMVQAMRLAIDSCT